MRILKEVVVGLIIACAGLFEVFQTPLPGCGAIFVGGFLILEGIDRAFEQ